MSHASPFSITVPQSRFYKGPYGRIFPNLPAWRPTGSDGEVLRKMTDLANTMIEDDVRNATDIADSIDRIEALEKEFGHPSLPAGYIYLGQFIAHDLTFDPMSHMMRENDPSGLWNHRTPRLDLDSIYGGGPKTSPHLYDRKDPGLFNIRWFDSTVQRGRKYPDLPRIHPLEEQGLAIIPDPRNDENSIISQLHLAFLLAHNELYRRACRNSKSIQPPFEQANRTLRWLYQHIVWNDFLDRISDPDIHFKALHLTPQAPPSGRQYWVSGLKDIYDWKVSPYIPVEFSVAAFRFGHSMVRNSYMTNNVTLGPAFLPIFEIDSPQSSGSLKGFRPIPESNLIQWDWFLEMGNTTKGLPQRARKIDARLSNAVFELPPEASPHQKLALVNLMKGISYRLPSGTDVARKLCINPMEIEPEEDSLWYYILKESGSCPSNGERLGAVGSNIVCATIAGLLLGDDYSYFNCRPHWTPDNDDLLESDDCIDDKNWGLASIIRLSGLDPAGVGLEKSLP